MVDLIFESKNYPRKCLFFNIKIELTFETIASTVALLVYFLYLKRRVFAVTSVSKPRVKIVLLMVIAETKLNKKHTALLCKQN
jgi:hypothetical protein